MPTTCSRSKPMPTWGDTGAAQRINFDDIFYFVKAGEQTEKSWMTSPTTSSGPSTGSASPSGAQIPQRRFGSVRIRVVYHSVIEELERDV